MDRTRTSTAARAAARPGALIASLTALATLLAFAGGRWAADAAAPAGLQHPARTRPPPPAPDARQADTTWRAPASAEAPPAPPPAPAANPLELTPQGRPTPALVTRVTEEASRQLESARAELLARCVPATGLPGGRATARFTFNVTFDASGREIARGISEDRRAPAPEVAGCLRRLPLGTLRVTAPGANVGVRLAMNLP
jgi:hypothetical protein